MRHLVDTDWVIHALHGSPAVVQRLEELTNDGGIGISIISTAELYQGVFYSNEPRANEGNSPVATG